MALGSTDLAPLVQIARVIQVYRYAEVMFIAYNPGSSQSYFSHIITFYLREIQKTQASCGHKTGELCFRMVAKNRVPTFYCSVLGSQLEQIMSICSVKLPKVWDDFVMLSTGDA